MPFSFQPFGPPEEAGLPSWQDPRFNESASFGMTPEAIWNQAIAQYEAGLKGGGFSPEELDRRFLAPARLAVGMQQPESPWSGPIETAGGGIYQVNKATGAMRVIRTAGVPKPTTIHSPDLGVIQVDNAGNVRTLVEPKSKDGDTETITETYPAVPATEAMPEIPGKSGFFGWGATPKIPAVSAKPAVPQRRVEYKQPRVSSIQAAGTDVAPAVVPTTPDRVPVRSPSGKTGTIPLSQLPQALAEGYTRL